MPQKSQMLLAIKILGVLAIANFLMPLACYSQAPNLSSAQTEPIELFDRYYFVEDNEAFTVIGGGSVRGQSGTNVELLAEDCIDCISGAVTITSGLRALKARVVDLEVSIPPGSSLSLRIANDFALTVHDAKSQILISDIARGVAKIAVDRGETIPPGATPVRPLSGRISGHKATPLFFVGNAQLAKDKGEADVISVAFGQFFVRAPRDLKLRTPLGEVKVKANSRFFLSVHDGSVRLLNCSSDDVHFDGGKKFRRIPCSEEFCIFDHRPTKEELLPADGLGRKEVTLHDVDGEKNTAATSRFLLTTMLTSPFYLGDWKRKSALDKALESAMIKTAAAFDTSYPSSEQFFVNAPALYKELTHSSLLR